MSAASPSASSRAASMQIVKPGVRRAAAEVQVSACGRLCTVDGASQSSLSLLQCSVQNQLGMQGQTLQMRDADGLALVTDDDLRQAVEKGRLPLQASLADAAIHSMEMKRDEIAQMQWRLVREQFASFHSQHAALNSSIRELTDSLEEQKRALGELADRTRHDLQGAISKEANDRRSAVQGVTNRLENVAQAIHHEATEREIFASQQAKQMETAKDILAMESQQRLHDQSSIRREVEAVRHAVTSESQLREKANAELQSEVNGVQHSMDQVRALIRQEIHDREQSYARVFGEAADTAQALEKQLIHMQHTLQTCQDDIFSRVNHLDDRCKQADDHFLEQISQRAREIADNVKRINAISNDVERERSERKMCASVANAALERCEALSTSIIKVEVQSKDWYERERAAREDQCRALSNTITMFAKEAQMLDKVVTERIAEEVSARTAADSRLSEEISGVLSPNIGTMTTASPISTTMSSSTGDTAPCMKIVPRVVPPAGSAPTMPASGSQSAGRVVPPTGSALPTAASGSQSGGLVMPRSQTPIQMTPRPAYPGHFSVPVKDAVSRFPRQVSASNQLLQRPAVLPQSVPQTPREPLSGTLSPTSPAMAVRISLQPQSTKR